MGDGKVVVVRFHFTDSEWEDAKRAGYSNAEIRQILEEEGRSQLQSMIDRINERMDGPGHGWLRK